MASSKKADRKWFLESRFGMFIHWGLYAITGHDMWYYSREMVPKEEYETLMEKYEAELEDVDKKLEELEKREKGS